MAALIPALIKLLISRGGRGGGGGGRPKTTPYQYAEKELLKKITQRMGGLMPDAPGETPAQGEPNVFDRETKKSEGRIGELGGGGK